MCIRSNNSSFLCIRMPRTWSTVIVCSLLSARFGAVAALSCSWRHTRITSTDIPRHRRFAVLQGQSNDDDFIPLNELLLPSKDCQVDRMSSTDLAYVGDVVYELFVRSRTVWPPKKTSDLQTQVVAIVRAEHQSELLTRLREDFDLTEKEAQVLSRGRNSVSGSRNNRRNPAAYQDSTAFEALVGYLYITDTQRCAELMNWVNNNIDTI